MKTSVVMQSPDRELFGVKIRQESKSGHLNLSDLQAAYAVAQVQNGWARRDAYEVISTNTNAERLFYILEKRGSIKPDFSGFMEDVESQGMTKLLKAAGVYRTAGRGTNRSTWCDPYIWVLIAMELNPMLYAQTVIWLTDGLILNRIEAGNMYRGLSGAMARFPDTDFVGAARALNLVVFGKHENGIRQAATAAQLKELAALEENMAFSINMGFINSHSELLDALRRVWNGKLNALKISK